MMVDESYERSSSSVEDETMPTISSNPALLSPLSTVEKRSPLIAARVNSPYNMYNESIKTEKTDLSINTDHNHATNEKSVMVRIDLNRLKDIPALRRYLDPKRATWRSENVLKYNDKSRLLYENEVESNSRLMAVEKMKESDSETKKVNKIDQNTDRKHKKRKRRNSSSSVSSHSTISSMSHSSSKKNKENFVNNTKTKENRKAKRRKGDGTTAAAVSSDLIIPNNRSHTDNLTLTNAPATNHEREGLGGGSGSRLSPERTFPIRTSGHREYHSYFEAPEEPSEYEER